MNWEQNDDPRLTFWGSNVPCLGPHPPPILTGTARCEAPLVSAGHLDVEPKSRAISRDLAALVNVAIEIISRNSSMAVFPRTQQGERQGEWNLVGFDT